MRRWVIAGAGRPNDDGVGSVGNVAGGPADRAGEEGRARHQDVVGRSVGRGRSEDDLEGERHEDGQRPGPGGGARRPLDAGAIRPMVLLPTWTPHDECDERMTVPDGGGLGGLTGRGSRQAAVSAVGDHPHDPECSVGQVCRTLTDLSPPNLRGVADGGSTDLRRLRCLRVARARMASWIDRAGRRRPVASTSSWPSWPSLPL